MMGRSWSAALLVLVLGTACSREGAGRARPDAGPPFDVETMAFLSEARALHHEANVREDARDYTGAIVTVDRIVHAPHRLPARPEVEEVLADACARLAELELRTGDTGAASSAVTLGLSHAPALTYFRGHLVEVQGLIEEARATSLADAGHAEGATEARERAMKLLEEAVSIQQQVIEAALDAGPNERGRP